jgi:hypothetical protein
MEGREGRGGEEGSEGERGEGGGERGITLSEDLTRSNLGEGRSCEHSLMNSPIGILTASKKKKIR